MNFLLTILLTTIIGVGDFSTLVSGSDTVLIFPSDAIELRTDDDTNVDWSCWREGVWQSLGASMSQTFRSGDRVEAHRVGTETKLFSCYVFDLSDYRPIFTSFTLSPQCQSTEADLEGIIPPMTCLHPDGRSSVVAFPWQASFCYTATTWDDASTSWKDTIGLTEPLPLHTGHYSNLPPFFTATDFTLRYRPGLEGSCWDAFADSVISDTYMPVAVAFHPVAELVTRGAEMENEYQRPIDGTVISGSTASLSGPLNIAFYAHATSAVEYYHWLVRKSENILATRKEEQHRYIFEDPGVYTVSVSAWNNAECSCGSVELSSDSLFQVNVGESMLMVPNVFTPNGDGANDEFRVLYESLRTFHCQIFDRWGHLIYSWDDPAKGWDGTAYGRPAAAGAYYYVIRALGTDAPKDASYGTKLSYDKKRKNGDESVIGVYRLSGDINLIR